MSLTPQTTLTILCDRLIIKNAGVFSRLQGGHRKLVALLDKEPSDADREQVIREVLQRMSMEADTLMKVVTEFDQKVNELSTPPKPSL